MIMKHKKEHRSARIPYALFLLLMCVFLVSPLVCIGDDIIKDLDVDDDTIKVKSLEVSDHTIRIEQKEVLVVQETLLFNYTVYYHKVNSSGDQKPLSYNDTLYFWISSESTDVTIECQSLDIMFQRPVPTNVSMNLGENNLSIPINGNLLVNLSYSLSPPFDKKLVYKTYALEITISAEDYPWGSIPLLYDSLSDTYVSILGEQDTSFYFTLDFISPPSPSLWNMVSFILLGVVILLVLVILFILYRPKKDRMAKEPIESLELRKKLLMDILKTLEIERSKGKVPDTYYSVIKDDYKKEAVKVIQELEKRK
jgi:hypothetical protein